jgi:hypothetical protein
MRCQQNRNSSAENGQQIPLFYREKKCSNRILTDERNGDNSRRRRTEHAEGGQGEKWCLQWFSLLLLCVLYSLAVKQSRATHTFGIKERYFC